MKKTEKPQAGGILSIIAGVFGLLGSFGILIAIISLAGTGHWIHDMDYYYWESVSATPILWSIGIPMFFCGIMAVIGGIFAVQRKQWGLALAGSIAAFFPAWILGLLAVIFVAISHDEFQPEVKTAAINAQNI
jgi:hypothetical protein